MNKAANLDKFWEDSEMRDVAQQCRQMAIDTVAARGTTFTALRQQVEDLYGRPCDAHGLDFAEYRVRFCEFVYHDDIGRYEVAHDYVLDLTRQDSDWVAQRPVPVSSEIATLLVCL